ncbi:hypothetical protein FBU30_008008 [Linnemannia zychae]|nr:hypothetical protein FBU30_008008 [Linnemannia zychae]
MIQSDDADEHVQGFRAVHRSWKSSALPAVDPDDVVHIDCITDPDSKNDCVLWDDIQQAFNGAIFVRNKTKMLPFMKGQDLRPVEPRRIAAVPGVILDVVVGGEIPSNKSASPQLLVQEEQPSVSRRNTPGSPQAITVPNQETSPIAQHKTESIQWQHNQHPQKYKQDEIFNPQQQQTTSLMQSNLFCSQLNTPPPSRLTPQKTELANGSTDITYEKQQNIQQRNPEALQQLTFHQQESSFCSDLNTPLLDSVAFNAQQETNSKQHMNSSGILQSPFYTPQAASSPSPKVQQKISSVQQNQPQAPLTASSTQQSPSTTPHKSHQKSSSAPHTDPLLTPSPPSAELLNALNKAIRGFQIDASKSSSPPSPTLTAKQDIPSFSRGPHTNQRKKGTGSLYTSQHSIAPQDHAAAAAVKEFKGTIAKANLGDRNAQVILGDRYKYGRGIQQDYKAAMKWYMKAANQGDSRAQYDIGLMYEHGEGVTASRSNAFIWYLKSACQGFAEAQFKVATLYENGRGVVKSIPKATDWMLKAANQGHGEAQFRMGKACEDGNFGGPQDVYSSFRWYHLSALQGIADAQFKVAQAYDRGIGVGMDETKAVEWLTRATNQGLASAQYFLGVSYRDGRGVVQNFSKALECFLKAAEKGYLGAQIELFKVYEYGWGVPQDRAKATEWCLKAAEQGDMSAQIRVAKAYEEGIGVAIDHNKAITWYAKAAEKGDKGAQSKVAEAYEKGKYVPQGDLTSQNWYLHAIEQRGPQAIFKLAVAFGKGDGVPKNESKSFEWYHKAAKLGHPIAQYWIGYRYEQGDGVKKDYSKAMKWYLLAAQQGHPAAIFSVADGYYRGHGLPMDIGKSKAWEAYATTESAKKKYDKLCLLSLE